jgi:hypothetical protein
MKSINTKALFVLSICLIVSMGCVQKETMISSPTSTIPEFPGMVPRDVGKLPESFNISFSGDLSSSGGSRFYSGYMSLHKNELIYGTQKYVGTGTYECIYDPQSASWLDKETKEDCWIKAKVGYLYNILSREQLIKEISSSNFKPPSECYHYDICYTIIELSSNT